MIKRCIRAVTLLIAFFLLACQANPTPASTLTPTAASTVSSAEMAKPKPDAMPLPPVDESAQRVSVPPGFAIRIFAQRLNTPRFMAFGQDGALYVALMGSGQIARLPDRNGDGIADTVEIVARNLSQPHGIEWHDGWLYVAERDRVERFNPTFEIRTLVTDNIPCCGGHSTRTLHFGPDGKLYVSAGSSSNNNPETDPRRAAILRFNADGTIPADNPFASDADKRKQAVWASGLRNSVDFLWTKDGQLWANMMGSDGISDDAPPEAIVVPVQRGRMYGWPYCYTPTLGVNAPPAQQAQRRDLRVPLPREFECSSAIPALFTDLAHSAPLGMSFGDGKNFPAAFQNDLFVAYHGSWNTNTATNYRDCKVQRIVIENGSPVRSETFATGWRGPGKCMDESTWGRPADVIFGPDGAMYISDDKGGRVYRVIYTRK